MKCCAVSLALLFLTSASLFAQNAGKPTYLALRPADLPQPSLKYRLFPDPSQLTNGNAPTQYYRALSNQSLLSELRGEDWKNWLKLPLKDLPRKEVAEKVHSARFVIRELEVGSQRKQCDWGMEGRTDTSLFLLPESQSFRTAARPLAVRARLYIAEGKYTEACETLQIGYALAYHLSRGPTLIHLLTGRNIARDMTDQVETLLQQPDAPNLYWSLTVMPKPFADLRPALEAERGNFERMLPFLKELEMTPLSEEQVKAFQEKLDRANRDLSARPPEGIERLQLARTLTQAIAEGQRELVQRYKFTKEQVAAMPPVQAARLYAFRDYKEALEEVLKWGHVPEPASYPEYHAAQQRYGRALVRFGELFSPGLLDVKDPNSQSFPLENYLQTATETDRRLAALRCIEAMRQYAAKHDGKWPATLADVKDLPIPNDPLTGKPFEYAVNGDKATLALAKPPEKKPLPNQVLTYYLKLKPSAASGGRSSPVATSTRGTIVPRSPRSVLVALSPKL